MTKKSEGERGKIYFSEIDLKILRELAASRTKYSVDELRIKLQLAHMSTRRHLERLNDMGLVFRDRVPKKNKAILIISNEGKMILSLFERLVKKMELAEKSRRDNKANSS